MKRIQIRILALALTALAAVAHAQTPGVSQIPGRAYSQFEPSVRPAPSYTDVLVLSGGVAQSYALQSGVRWLVFGSTCTSGYFVNFQGATAAVPGVSTSTGAAATISPTAVYVPSGTSSVSVIASSGCSVSIDSYK